MDASVAAPIHAADAGGPAPASDDEEATCGEAPCIEEATVLRPALLRATAALDSAKGQVLARRRAATFPRFRARAARKASVAKIGPRQLPT